MLKRHSMRDMLLNADERAQQANETAPNKVLHVGSSTHHEKISRYVIPALFNLSR